MSDSREAQLLRQLQDKDEQMARLQEKLALAEKEIALLRGKLDALARRLFGAKSEALDQAQLLLLLQGAAEGPAQGKESGPEVPEADPPRSSKASPKERRERAPRLPEHLPVLEEIIDPEPVKASPEQWRCIGEEVSEQLDFEPQRFFRRRVVRRKYVQRGAVDAVPVVAPLPGKLLERGIAGAGLLAHVVVSKYCDHLPLYRQEYIYESRYGVKLPRQTLARFVELAADWLRPIVEAINAEILASRYVQIDETPIHYLAPGHGKTKLGYLWTCCQPTGDVVYHWETSRAAAVLEKIVPVDFRGTLQCDGYKAYASFAEGRGAEITLAGCLAHARRNFFEAKEQAPQIAGFILRQMQSLYAIEKELRECRAGPQLRAAVRAARSRPIMERLHRLAVRLEKKRRFLPASLMGKAIAYLLAQWTRLCVYLADGQVEIDNNLVENAIRPTAVGKKNWLFIGEAQAGERSAIIYTVIECCRRRGLDPFAYLREVFTRLPSMTNWQIKDITPKAWAEAQRAALRQAA